MKRLILFIFFILFVTGAANTAYSSTPSLKNIHAEQNGDEAYIYYDLSGEGKFKVSLKVSSDGGKTFTIAPSMLRGDIGGTVSSGRGKKIIWNPLKEGVDLVGDDFVFEVKAVSVNAAAEGMVFIKGGCFDMGDTFGEGDSDEKPVHKVCVDDFYMGEHEVTVGEFHEFVDATEYRTEAEKGDGCYYWTGSEWKKDRAKVWRSPGFKQHDTHPVTCVSWNDANELAKWKKKKTGFKYRLPTEAEWEYGAREKGKKVRFGTGKNIVGPDNANFGSSSKYKKFYSRVGVYRGKTISVKSFRPNALGLYDMSGNVWEWVSDWYGKGYYRNSPRNNPKGPSSGSYRVFRGGSWNLGPRGLRAAVRLHFPPDFRLYSVGFRLARTP